MSKRAEEAALEAYPDSTRDGLGILTFWGYSQRYRDCFIKGYETAEKDLALTWEDIKTIEQIIATSDWYDFEISDKLWSQEFYEEVLKRFREAKK